MTMLFMITPNNITNYMSVIQKYQQQQSQYRHSRGNLTLFPTSVAVACAAIRFAEVFVVEVGYNRGKQRCNEEQHRAQAPRVDLGGVVGRPGVELRRPEGLPHEAAEGAAELGRRVVLLAGEGARLPGVADLQLERAVLPDEQEEVLEAHVLQRDSALVQEGEPLGRLADQV